MSGYITPMRRLRNVLPLCAALLLGAGFAADAQEARLQLKGSVSPPVRRARPLNRLNANEMLRFSFTLPLRNQAQLDTLLKRLYTPGDPLFHHFLSSPEFTARFGPTQADYAAVIAYARAQGFTIAETFANRAVLSVTATAQQAEKAFGLRLMNYQSPQGRIFRAPDAEPSLPAAIAQRVSGLVGMDTALEPGSNVMLLPVGKPYVPTPQKPGAAHPNAVNSGIVSGPNGGLSPGDIKTAYNLNGVAETGAGQTIALFELDGYIAGDITTYENYYGLTHTPVQNVLVDGVSGTPTAPTLKVPSPNGPLEVTLDIELAIALAPGATKILVYEGSNFVNIYTRIAADNAAQQVSTSWYPGAIDSNTASSILNGENTAFQQMAAQGQSIYAASGDYGSNVRIGTDSNNNPILKFGVQDPSSQQWVCGVGGTTLGTNGAGGAWQSEPAWSGSGGGVSGYASLPTYQSQVVSAGSGSSSTLRNVPDVALNSNTGYSIYYSNVYNNGGGWTGSVGGTSCAAPLWAGFTALVNQRRASSGLGNLGFPNPLLYEIGNLPTTYASDFHDITGGNNGTYPAVTGYDNVTGWGSFNGGSLIYDMQVNGYAFYVDGSYNGATQTGTRQYPYHTVTQAVNAAPSSGVTLIYIRGNTYPENITIGKPILLLSDGGAALIGGN